MNRAPFYAVTGLSHNYVQGGNILPVLKDICLEIEAFWLRALEPHDPLIMLKALISQAWHCLSDAQLEEALKGTFGFFSLSRG